MPKETVKIFVAYSRADKDLKSKLLVHLSPLKRQGVIHIWDDGLISAGDDWDGNVKENLEAADIVLMLVSADFLDSEYCFEVEIKRAVERHDAGEAKVIPILLRPCHWKGAPFASIQLLPEDAKPVTTWDDQDLAFTSVVEEIRKVAEGFQEEKRKKAEADARRKAEAQRRKAKAEAKRKAERELELLFRRIKSPLDGEVESFQKIPSGEFLMGSPESEEGRTNDEAPQHRVVIRSPFLIAAVPVTVGQYRIFDPEHRAYWEGRVPEGEISSHPTVGVSMEEALAFCDWLAESWPWAHGARLPTEEEWEYACRAGSTTRYWSGDAVNDLRKVAWYKENSDHRTHRVGEKAANGWGLYDMHGNVWELTMSKWTDDYSGHSGRNAVESLAIDRKSISDLRRNHCVIRGGGFGNFGQGARAAKRVRDELSSGGGYLGFRVLIPSVVKPQEVL